MRRHHRQAEAASDVDRVADVALGARMTGGGFGGCVIALVPEDALRAVSAAVPGALRAAGFNEPTLVRTSAAAGAGPVA